MGLAMSLQLDLLTSGLGVHRNVPFRLVPISRNHTQQQQLHRNSL